MNAIATALALTFVLTLPVTDAAAAIYSYKDESGRTVFVDQEHKVPAKYRGTASTIQEQRDRPAPVAAAEGEGSDGTQAEGTASGATEGGEPQEAAEAPARTLVDRETQMRARQQVEMLDRERARQTPVMVRGNRVMVPAEVGSGNRTVHLMLLLDRGSANTVFYRNSVSGLALGAGEQLTVKIAGNRTVKAEKVTIGFVDIGPFEIKDVSVLLMTPQQESSLPFDGILGMDFLKGHPHDIDYENEIIRWKATPP